MAALVAPKDMDNEMSKLFAGVLVAERKLALAKANWSAAVAKKKKESNGS